MARTVVPYSGYGAQGLQVFTPTKVVSVAPAGTLDLSQTATQDKAVCVRVSTATDYKINGTGLTATMPVGCTGVGDKITSMSFPNGALIEVM